MDLNRLYYLYISHKNGKNNLYKIVEALLGRDLTQEEEANGLDGKFFNSLINKQVRVLLEKKASKKDSNKFFSDIVNFLPIDIEAPSLTSEELKTITENKEKNKQNKDNQSVNNDEFTQRVAEEDIPEEIRVENIPF